MENCKSSKGNLNCLKKLKSFINLIENRNKNGQNRKKLTEK